MGKTQAQLSASASRERSPREIQKDIDETRAEMDQTVDELSEILSPRHVWEQLVERVRVEGMNQVRRQLQGGGGQFARFMAGSIWKHPVPSVLAGAAISWLIAEKRNPDKMRLARMVSGLVQSARASARSRRVRARGWMQSASPGTRNPLSPAMEIPSSSTKESFKPMYEEERIDQSSGPASCCSSNPGGGSQVRQSTSSSETSHPGGLSDAAAKAADTASRVGQSVSDATTRARQRVSDAASRARQTAAQTADTVSEWSRQKLDQVRSSGEMARERFRARASDFNVAVRSGMDRMKSGLATGRSRAGEIFDEYPLVIGASALALGILVGIALPSTRRERKLFGRQASRFLERGRQVAQAAASAAKDAAQRQGLSSRGIKEAVQEVAREAGSAMCEQGLTGEGLTEKLESVADEAANAARNEIGREKGSSL
jgi:vacuolar-type H+-ATPase subunit H